MMRTLSFLVLLTLSYVTCATIEKTKICVQGGPVPAECPNNAVWNSVTCKFQCAPHCVSNEGNFIFPAADGTGTSFRQQCNACNCRADGTVGICTKMGCLSTVCYDDAGVQYKVGSTITRGCKTGTCISSYSKVSWSWYTPASLTLKPNCPYGAGIFNNDTCKWECPTTCQDGSTPRKCSGGLPPCSVVRCGFNTECADNYCPNYPNKNRGACTATCVAPALCTKNPCQAPLGQPKCGINQVCEADYRFGCGYQCRDVTCEFNEQIYQVGETRQDDCNTCTCGSDGAWGCTEQLCVKPTDKPICIQGGAVPPQCPNNNRWNAATCQFECVCPQNQNCGFNGAWDYDQCACVVNTPSPVATSAPTCATPQAPRCDFAPAVFDQTTCKWSCPSTCANGNPPVNCLINPCTSKSAPLCDSNSECVANYCNGGCGASCQTKQPIVQCLIEPCSTNSCGNGQTCVNDYAGGCNYRCV